MPEDQKRDPSLFQTWLGIAFIFSLFAGIGKGIANLINGEDSFFTGILDEMSWLFWIIIIIVIIFLMAIIGGIFRGNDKSKYI